MKTNRLKSDQAFALLLTLSLLALLVLVLLALSALTKVDTQVASTAGYQTQARQNALLGLNFSLGQLQQLAGPDKSLTGTADIVPSSKPINGRWTGVWLDNDINPRWLVSGNVSPASYAPTFQFAAELPTVGRKVFSDSPEDIVLVGSGSTNTSTTTDRYFIGDVVIVPRVPIPAYNAAGVLTTAGNYAYWVGDEGVKLSAALPGENPPGSPASTTHAVSEIPGGWTPTANALKALSYEQLISNAGPGVVGLKSTFHGTTLVHLGYLDYPSRRSGLININSAGTRLWRGVLGTFNGSLSTAKKADFATAIASSNIWSYSNTDKILNGPYKRVAEFINVNNDVRLAITASGSNYTNFQNAIGPWLTVRSDTFRIRAYGDALNPIIESGQSAGKVEAVAYCEAIVQRVKDSAAADGHFVITYFRWLGPDDI